MDWRKLAPHRPLVPDDLRYIPRPGPGGDRLATELLAGASPILVAGPAGIGKSTELNRTVGRLREKGLLVLHLALDTTEDMEALDARGVLLAIGQAAVLTWAPNGLVSGPLEFLPIVAQEAATTRPAVDYALTALRKAAARKQQERATLVLDGLEKVRDAARLSGIMSVLAQVAHEADLILVVPWDLMLGSSGVEPLPGWSPKRYVLEAIAAFDRGGQGMPIPEGLAFFEQMLLRRLGVDQLPDPQALLVFHKAVSMSGGIPRIFLQLIRDAGVHASVERDAEWPTHEELEVAVAAQVLTLRRLVSDAEIQVLHGLLQGGRHGSSPEILRLLHTGMIVEQAGKRVVTPLGEQVAKAGPL